MIKKNPRSCQWRHDRPALLGNKAIFSCWALGLPESSRNPLKMGEDSRVTGPGRAGDKRIFNLLIYILSSCCSQRGFQEAGAWRLEGTSKSV